MIMKEPDAWPDGWPIDWAPGYWKGANSKLCRDLAAGKRKLTLDDLKGSHWAWREDVILAVFLGRLNRETE